MPEIKEVIRRLYLTRDEFEERFPDNGTPRAGLPDRVMVEEVYRPARLEEIGAHASLRVGADRDMPPYNYSRLVLRGTRFASGRWLSQPQSQQAHDAEHTAPAC